MRTGFNCDIFYKCGTISPVVLYKTAARDSFTINIQVFNRAAFRSANKRKAVCRNNKGFAVTVNIAAKPVCSHSYRSPVIRQCNTFDIICKFEVYSLKNVAAIALFRNICKVFRGFNDIRIALRSFTIHSRVFRFYFYLKNNNIIKFFRAILYYYTKAFYIPYFKDITIFKCYCGKYIAFVHSHARTIKSVISNIVCFVGGKA